MTRGGMLTFPQRRALGGLLRTNGRKTAKELFTRSDVLWRLEERGYVRRGVVDEWSITSAGAAAYEEAMKNLP